MADNPLSLCPRPPFPSQTQGFPGRTGDMKPKPDHGEHSYKGSGRLKGKAALITGGDSGIGRAVAIASYQKPFESLEACEDDEWEKHFAVNVHSQFYLTKAAVAAMKPGASVIATASVNTKHPMPKLFAYSATKGAIGNMVMSWAQVLAEKGIRVNGVMPGPIWTPFIPAGMSADDVTSFGSHVPYGRPGQPVEVTPPYVMLAADENSYISGALVTVAGGMPIF